MITSEKLYLPGTPPEFEPLVEAISATELTVLRLIARLKPEATCSKKPPIALFAVLDVELLFESSLPWVLLAPVC